MEQRLRCRPREGRGLYRQPRFVQHRRRHVAVPARGAGCIGVVRKKNNFITLLPSPWGARAASTAIPQYLPKGTEVAVPARGADCIHEVLCGNLRLYVAVPARGAGCITKACEAWLKEHALPSPRGVRVASAKGYKPVSAHLSVPYNPQAQYNTRTAKNARRFVPVIQKTRV